MARPGLAALGIDFGTADCRATVMNESGREDISIPSIIAEDPRGGLVAGRRAAQLTERQPELAVTSIKRLLGRRVGTPEVEWLAAATPQLLEQSARGIQVRLGSTFHSAQALGHKLMQVVVEEAEAHMSPKPPKRRHLQAVVTIPAIFDLPQRLALLRLAKHAGLTVKRVIESPIATLLSMDLPRDLRRVVVVDWGAGYFDVAMVERADGGWTMLGSDGDALLGTDDLDHRVMDLLIEHFYDQHHVDLSTSGRALSMLQRQARKIRLEARRRQQSATVITNIARVRGQMVPLVHPPLGPRELEALWVEELEALTPPCVRLYGDLGLGTDDIDGLVLVGGASRIPFIRAHLSGMFRHEAITPGEAHLLAARGAGILAYESAATGPVVQSTLPHTLSVKADRRQPVPITQRHQPLPIRSTHFFKPTDPHGGPIDLWLCQGEQEHGYDAFRIARAHLEDSGDGSYVAEIAVSLQGDISFHVQPSSALHLEQPSGPVAPSSLPPPSEGTPQIVVSVEGASTDTLAALALEEEEEEALFAQPTIQARRVEADSAPAPSSKPDKVLRRSMFGRTNITSGDSAPPRVGKAQVAEVVSKIQIPASRDIDQSGPVSLRTAEDPIVGKVLGGRYEVTDILGEGAMARVYTARHQILGNKYAVKVMHPTLASDANLRERFLREARAAAAIDSDHVVRILDFGRAEDGRDYFVMEYLEGSSLEDEIQKRLVPLPLVFKSMIHVARGLEAAHAHKIVHRDLKPENIWITQVGSNMRTKILDFGVAKIPTAEAGLTMGNSIIGTPYYMAPEQVTGGDIDARTDIYAFGIVMYELLTGQLPYNHESLAFVLAMQCDMPLPSPRKAAGPSRCSEELDALIRKCAEKKMDARFATASELRKALEAVPRPT